MSDGKDDLRLTIPYPSYIPRARGIHAVGKFGDFFKVWVSQAQHELVSEAAAHLGLKNAEFIRWCAVMAAREVMRDVQEPQHANEAEPVSS